MFAFARMVGTPRDTIRLQTRRATDVANEQALAPDATAVARYARLRAPTVWKQRRGAVGVYNCFGLVWANRRTAIYEESELLKILADDGYRSIPVAEIDLGDVALYRTEQLGILHVAIVVRLDPVGTTIVPWLLSKWADWSGEDFHSAYDVPNYWRPFSLEWWTDR